MDLPTHYVRVREGSGLLFRVDGENRQRRLDLQPVAVLNLNTGDLRPQGKAEVTEADRAAAASWLAARREREARREMDEGFALADRLGQAAHWAGRAPDAALAASTETLLLAIHDLRSVLVKRMAERTATEAPSPPAPSAP